jgi:hypothetical protein
MGKKAKTGFSTHPAATPCKIFLVFSFLPVTAGFLHYAFFASPKFMWNKRLLLHSQS